MAYTFNIKGALVSAKAGQFIHCDAFGRFLRVVDILSSGLGLNYQVERDGKLSRVFF